jgi:hypothetical protein
MGANNNTFDLIVIALVLGTMLAVFVGLLWLWTSYSRMTRPIQWDQSPLPAINGTYVWIPTNSIYLTDRNRNTEADTG